MDRWHSALSRVVGSGVHDAHDCGPVVDCCLLHFERRLPDPAAWPMEPRSGWRHRVHRLLDDNALALSTDLEKLLLGGVRTRTPPSFVCISHAIHIHARESTLAHTLSTGKSTAGDKSHVCNYPASIPRFTHEFDWMKCVLKPTNREISTKIQNLLQMSRKM